MTEHHDRHLAIVLYGFAISPRVLADEVGYDDVQIVELGELVGKQLSSKNRITWRYLLFADDDWDEAISKFIDRLGGTDRLKGVIRAVGPGAAWLRVCLPSIGSPWQESNGFARKTLALLVELGLDFDIAMFEYDAARPTHGERPYEPINEL